MFRILIVTLVSVFASSTFAGNVIIKFKEDSGVELSNGSFVSADDRSRRGLAPEANLSPELVEINQQLSTDNISATRTFQFSDEALIQWKETAEAYWNEDLQDLRLYFSVDVAEFGDEDRVNNLMELEQLAIVESVEEIPDPEPALATPSFFGSQGYLHNDGDGVHAIDAWALPGGKGNSVKAVDIEGAWQVTHEDMPNLFYNSGSFSTQTSWNNHGTAVIGVMGGIENSLGVSGIAPNAQYGVQSVFISGAFPAAMTAAAMQAGNGGLVIIELHYSQSVHFPSCSCNFTQCGYVPAEFYSAHFQAIKQAVGNGVIVIEAAGNGSVYLDDPDFNSLFDRSVQDSGAIMVGASLSGSRSPACFTNYGARVDVHGWGENVTTLGYGDAFSGIGNNPDRFYTHSFSGTSSASPIVAGSALSVQGILGAHGKPLLDSVEMRDLLTTTGENQTGGFSRQIGPLPNIIRAVNAEGIGVETMATFIDDLVCAPVKNASTNKISTVCW